MSKVDINQVTLSGVLKVVKETRNRRTFLVLIVTKEKRYIYVPAYAEPHLCEIIRLELMPGDRVIMEGEIDTWQTRGNREHTSPLVRVTNINKLDKHEKLNPVTKDGEFIINEN